MKKNLTLTFSSLCVVAMAMATSAFAQEFTIDKEQAAYNEPDYSPFVDQHFPTRVLWGDTHLHTANSFDAGFVGTTLGPDEAYRFARGTPRRSGTRQAENSKKNQPNPIS